jgi:hypothetical protein
MSTSEVSDVVSLRVWGALTLAAGLARATGTVASAEAETLETWAQRVVRPVAVEGVKRKKGRVIDMESGA